MPEETDRQALVGQRRELYTRLVEQEYAYQQLRLTHGAYLIELQSRADATAQEFKQCFAAATQAFNERRGADAKNYSLRGKELQRQCVALNTEANALRATLREALEAVKRTQHNIAVLSERIACAPTRPMRAEPVVQPPQIPRPLSAPRAAAPSVPVRNPGIAPPPALQSAAPVLDGFDSRSPLSASDVQSLLDRFPRSVIERVERISYSKHELFKEGGVLISGRTGKNRMAGKYVVEIYRAEPEQNDDLAQTLGHEIGHIVYHEFLTDGERRRWGELFVLLEDEIVSAYSQKNAEEDFCELVGFSLAHAEKLGQDAPVKYEFFRRIWSRIQ